jgi:hypothetical protein
MTEHKAAHAVSVVVAALALVHWIPVNRPSWALAAEAPKPVPQSRAAAAAVTLETPLPSHVAEMREMILTAVRSGKIEDLKTAIDWNELPPEVGALEGADPIEHLRKVSADGAGREILALLDTLLQSAPVILPVGRDPENNGVYVWPAVSEANLEHLTPAQEVALYRLMPVAQAKTLVASKKWTWWRLAIGADGTWLTFMKHD